MNNFVMKNMWGTYIDWSSGDCDDLGNYQGDSNNNNEIFGGGSDGNDLIEVVKIQSEIIKSQIRELLN